MSALHVTVDGTPLPDDEARAFWKRFSAWMEEHPSDLGGFARSEGLVSVHPQMRDGAPVLVASRTAPQGPYVTAREHRAEGGSGTVHDAGRGVKQLRKPKKRRG